MTEKLIILAFLFGGVLIYALLDPRKSATYDFRIWLDREIPFIPAFAIAYLGLFLFVPVTLLLIALTPLALPYLFALSVAMYTGAVVWFFFPSRMHAPRVLGNSFSHKLANSIYRGDPHANGLPSAHVFSSFISAYYLSVAFPTYAFIVWLVGIFIALSTLFIKRHQVADFIAGTAWAVASILIAGWLIG